MTEVELKENTNNDFVINFEDDSPLPPSEIIKIEENARVEGSSPTDSLGSGHNSFNLDLNVDINQVVETTKVENEKKKKIKCPKFIKEAFKLLIYGVKEQADSDSPPQLNEETRTMWNLYGALPNEKNFSNCFGLFSLSRNLQNCFGLLKKKKKKGEKQGLGMLLGVILPVILNIFGVILFLRLPMGVGNGGIGLTIGMFTLGYLVTGLTVCSICAISTNGTIKGGGAYYMISRILGPEFGGAIGISLFLGNVAGGALYIIGFIDSLLVLVPVFGNFFYGDSYWSKVIICTAVLIILSLICIVGADFFSKTGFLIFLFLMVAMIATIISFSFGSFLFGAKIFEKFQSIGYTGWSLTSFLENFYPYTEKVVPISTVFQRVVNNCTELNIVNRTVSFINSCNVTVPSVLPTGSYYLDIETNSRLNFQKLFSVLFPACTGAMAGANLSGDLKNPGKSIPKGTIFALIFTYIIYVFLIILFGSTTAKWALITDYSIVSKISFSPIVVSIGIFAATISSGLTSIIGGSRVLSAIAKDNLIPFLGWFSVDFGWPFREPRLAVIFTSLLIQILIFASKIGVIAPFVTQFFLVAYGMVNFACFALVISRTPNFRPHFKYFSWWSCLSGFILCIFLMFFLDWIYALVTLISLTIVIGIIFAYAKPKNWGDIIRAIIFFFSKIFTLRLNSKIGEHIKYWRLKVLVLVNHPKSHFKIIRLFDDMSRVKGGLAVCGMVKTGEFREGLNEYERDKSAFYDLLKEAKLQLFFEITFSKNLRIGIQNLLLHAGFSGMNPDIVSLGFYENKCFIEDSKEHIVRGKTLQSINDFSEYRKTNKEISSYMNSLIDILLFKNGVIIARNYREIQCRRPQNFLQKITRKKLYTLDIYELQSLSYLDETDEIDIENSTSLMFQLANLLLHSYNWKRHHKLRVMCIIDKHTDDKEKKIRQKYNEFFNMIRIDAKIVIISLESELEKIVEANESKKISRRRDDGKPPRSGMRTKKTFKGKKVVELKVTSSIIDGENKINAREGREEGGGGGDKNFLEKPKMTKKPSFDDFDIEKMRSQSVRMTKKGSLNSILKSSNEGIEGSKSIKDARRSVTFDDLRALRERRREIEFEIEKEKSEIDIDGNFKIQFKDKKVRLKVGEKELSKMEEMKIYNSIIKNHSTNTSLIFVTLPTPPKMFGEMKSHVEYYHVLNTLTKGSKPMFLVHSKTNVISTDL